MENAVESIVGNDSFEAAVAAGVTTPTTTPATPVTAKVDRRRGSRKTVNADGTVSYGVKSDGTPRAKPGRRAKAVDVAA